MVEGVASVDPSHLSCAFPKEAGVEESSLKKENGGDKPLEKSLEKSLEGVKNFDGVCMGVKVEKDEQSEASSKISQSSQMSAVASGADAVKSVMEEATVNGIHARRNGNPTESNTSFGSIDDVEAKNKKIKLDEGVKEKENKTPNKTPEEGSGERTKVNKQESVPVISSAETATGAGCRDAKTLSKEAEDARNSYITNLEDIITRTVLDSMNEDDDSWSSNTNSKQNQLLSNFLTDNSHSAPADAPLCTSRGVVNDRKNFEKLCDVKSAELKNELMQKRKKLNFAMDRGLWFSVFNNRIPCSSLNDTAPLLPFPYDHYDQMKVER